MLPSTTQVLKLRARTGIAHPRFQFARSWIAVPVVEPAASPLRFPLPSPACPMASLPACGASISRKTLAAICSATRAVRRSAPACGPWWNVRHQPSRGVELSGATGTDHRAGIRLTRGLASIRDGGSCSHCACSFAGIDPQRGGSAQPRSPWSPQPLSLTTPGCCRLDSPPHPAAPSASTSPAAWPFRSWSTRSSPSG